MSSGIQSNLFAISDVASKVDSLEKGVQTAQYRARLRAYLQTPTFRQTTGFPLGDDETILALSLPPYYTACPNPFIEEIVEQWQLERTQIRETLGLADDTENPAVYHREPFAVDVSEGKHDPIYKVHSYHTKVPPLAILHYILHYTEPGDIILDAFCGSGMVGVAVQWANLPEKSMSLRNELIKNSSGAPNIQLGKRRVILCDLSPAATAIAANYNLPANGMEFAHTAKNILNTTREKTKFLYTSNKENVHFIYGVWSQIFDCPQCANPINFMQVAFDLNSREVRDEFACSDCGIRLTKRALEPSFIAEFDPIRNGVRRHVNYELFMVARGARRNSVLAHRSEADQKLVEHMETLPLPPGTPIFKLPLEKMYHGSRLKPKGVEYLHDLYFKRQLYTLTTLWEEAKQIEDTRLRSAVLFLFDQVLMNASKLARYPQLSPLGGVFYLPSMVTENEPLEYLEKKLETVKNHFDAGETQFGQALISTNSATEIRGLPDNSMDYVFTDPPFGENIFYADLNLIPETWYGVRTDSTTEAIIDKFKAKGISDYQRLMTLAFLEYYRVLKPGRWMTVEFHNSDNAVWNTIQQAIIEAGFVVADVRILDKQQRSFRQATSDAMKQDLIISAYKPTHQFVRFFTAQIEEKETVWEFVRNHLSQLPVVVESGGVIETLRERQAFLIYDRLVAYYVQHGAPVPLPASEFLAGLAVHFIQRDGMVFLLEQVPLYDQARLSANHVARASLFVNDEKSALQWLRLQLDPHFGGRPHSRQEITPIFIRELHKASHEALPDLGVLLEQNFLQDEEGNWYVPDLNTASDLEKLRKKALLREFKTYQESKGQLKQFRTEAVRAGFADAYQRRDFQNLLIVAHRLPETVLQEDPDLLMYFDAASLRED